MLGLEDLKGAIAIVTIELHLLMGSIVGLAVASAASLERILDPNDEKKRRLFSAIFSSCNVLRFLAGAYHAAKCIDDPVLYGGRQNLYYRYLYGSCNAGYLNSSFAVCSCASCGEEERLSVLWEDYIG